MTQQKRFRSNTVAVLDRFGEWMRENADKLADAFTEGCQEYSIELSFRSGELPVVHLSADRVDKKMIDAMWLNQETEDDRSGGRKGRSSVPKMLLGIQKHARKARRRAEFVRKRWLGAKNF